MISAIYNTFFYEPLYNGLVFLTNHLPYNDLGLAIIVLTLVVRFILFPLSHRSTVTQRKMKEIEPEIAKVKDKFKKDKQEQTRQIMALYRAHGVSPFSGFLILLIQLPIFIALFMMLRKGGDFDTNILYSFIHLPENINTMLLGLIDVSKSHYFLSVLAGLSQFFQIKLAMPNIKKASPKERSFKADFQRSMSIQMKYIMPIFVFFIAQRFSSGMALYWTTSNVFAIVHEAIVARKAKSLKKNLHGRTGSDNKTIDRGFSKQANSRRQC